MRSYLKKTGTALAAFLCALTPHLAAAQTGSATGANINAMGVQQVIAASDLPGGGGYAAADQLSTTLSPFTAGMLTSLTTGLSSASASGVQSISSAADVSLLGGVVRAARVVAVTNASQVDGVVTTSSEGSAFEGLSVNGVALGDVSPNTRISLPGRGYVILNEQVSSASGIAVNMIHVVLTAPFTGLTIGEIIVGSASSGM